MEVPQNTESNTSHHMPELTSKGNVISMLETFALTEEL